jgi:hypothetical protein
MRSIEEHKRLNEDIQNLLSYIGELIDEPEVTDKDEFNQLYEWLENIMVYHYDHYIAN